MAGNVQEKQLRWYNIALMSFITVWGFGNVVALLNKSNFC